MSDRLFISVRCQACGCEFIDQAESARCPSCSAVIHRVAITEAAMIYDGHKARGIRAGLSRGKGWFSRSESKPVRQNNRAGAMARSSESLIGTMICTERP